jgi:hypothetical protein
MLVTKRPPAPTAPSEPAPARTPSLMIEYVEQCRCGQCDAAIPQQSIQANLLPQRLGQGVRRRIRAFCEHCNIAYGATRELRGGTWQMVGSVEILAGKEFDSFKRRLDFLRGNRQVGA